MLCFLSTVEILMTGFWIACDLATFWNMFSIGLSLVTMPSLNCMIPWCFTQKHDPFLAVSVACLPLECQKKDWLPMLRSALKTWLKWATWCVESCLLLRMLIAPLVLKFQAQWRPKSQSFPSRWMNTCNVSRPALRRFLTKEKGQRLKAARPGPIVAKGWTLDWRNTRLQSNHIQSDNRCLLDAEKAATFRRTFEVARHPRKFGKFVFHFVFGWKKIGENSKISGLQSIPCWLPDVRDSADFKKAQVYKRLGWRTGHRSLPRMDSWRSNKISIE